MQDTDATLPSSARHQTAHASPPQDARHGDNEQDTVLPSLHDIVAQLRATANPSTARSVPLSEEELRKQAAFESLDYYKSYPDMYMTHIRETFLKPTGQRDGTARNWHLNGTSPSTADEAEPSLSSSSAPYSEAERHVALRWLLHVLIAVSVGVMATVVSYAVEVLEKYRALVLQRCLHSTSLPVLGDMAGCLWWVGASAALVVVASSVVTWYEPAAAGGGIPDVMAYLNGVHLRKAMNLRTFVAKTISCVSAVASGLPVGLEAPLIHLGAIVGAGVTQGRSRTLGFQTSLFRAFRNNKDRRDFITAGAACGVSVAFGAPIGGLLFVMEEVSSFWDYSASGQIFLATMLCFTVSTIINSIVEDRRLLGWVSNAAHVLFEVNVTIPLNLVALFPALLLGAILGALAALFTKVSLVLIQWRRTHITPAPLRRLADAVLVSVVFSVLTFGCALITECRPVKVITDPGESVVRWGTESSSRLFNGTCTTDGTYSPLGSLSLHSGKNVIRHLFSRQTAAEFPPHQLAFFFLFYFVSTCAVSGVAVSGGLVVPSLVIGALFGRLYGLLLWKVGAADVGLDDGYRTADAWMDPGVFALIGAGAFLAGTSRMTMSICVIMVELSSELHYLLPVMVAIVMSKTVADWLCEPLYHQQMRLECVPYLPPHLLRPEFEMLTAADVMAADVVMLRTRERTDVILHALRATTHHAFPVVDLRPVETAAADDRHGFAHATTAQPSAATSLHYRLVGLVTREDLQVLLTLPELHAAGRAPVAAPASPVPLTDPASDGFGGRLDPEALKVRAMTWARFNAHKASLFLHVSDRHDWVRRRDEVGTPASTGEERVGLLRRRARSHLSLFTLAGRVHNSADEPVATEEVQDEAAPHAAPPLREEEMLASMPAVLDISVIVNRSPWVIPPFFNLQMAYHTFRSMGLRHMVVVDGDTVCGVITRKDLLLDTLTRRTRELRERLTDEAQGRATDATETTTQHVVAVRVDVPPTPSPLGPPQLTPPGVAARATTTTTTSMTRDIMDDLFSDEL